jgi:four helix bundle protein
MEKDLEQGTKRFALAVLEFVSNLPLHRTADILVRQLLRSATSMGANYREANRGVSRADFTNKIGTVQKEAAETQILDRAIDGRGSPTRNPSKKGIDRTSRDFHLDRKTSERVVRTILFSHFYFSLSNF